MRSMNANTVIDNIGGNIKTAELCEVSPQAVSQWRRDGIPKARLMYLKAVRPDAFDDVDANVRSAQSVGVVSS